MFVIKRDGRKENVSFDKVLRRLEKMSEGITVNYHEIAQKVCSRIFDGVNTDKLDELAAYICSSMIADDPDYDKLASRIVVSNHHKKTNDKFSDTIEELYNNDVNQLISGEVYEVVQQNKEVLDKKIQYDRDYLFDYFGFKTLEKSYLLGINNKIIERPQDLFMRVSIGIHGNNIDKVIETYNCLSEKYFVHATPTLFNFGTKRQQGSSCFVAGTPVFTVNRGIVPIEEVCIGDNVITHTGSVKPVVQTHKNLLDNRQLYNIKVYKTPSFDVTGNHRFWSITKEQIGWKESPQWNSIEQLRVGDWISTPKSNTYEKIDMYYEDSRLEKNERVNTTMEIDGNIFLRINDKTKITENLPTYVYTLGVKDDHSYSVAGVIAENCFLVHMESDSVDGMYNTLHDCAMISKYAGGIGLHIHNIRSNGSLIRGTNGVSSGIIPMLRVFNNTARHINQAGKRNGSIAIYLEPWHGDIYAFLDMKKNHGNEEERARDLFYALWIPDLFMQRVEENGKWSLMCPDQCKGLSDVYDEDDQKNFTELYTKYESEGKYLKQVDAQDLWFKILESQIETGTPYILYKDSVNRKSNHKNLGIVKSSNLCVAPETKILTSEGYKVISELKDQEVEVFNGDEFSSVIVKQTGQNQKLLTIKTSRGQTLRCTPYHKFYVYENEKNKKEIMVEAQNLKEGMSLVNHDLPLVEETSEDEMKYSYTHGFFCADGTEGSSAIESRRCSFQAKMNGKCMRHQHNLSEYNDDSTFCQASSYSKRKFVDLYHDKKELLQYIEHEYANVDHKMNKIRCALPYDVQEKYYVPINQSLKVKLEWLAGYFDGDGCVIKHTGGKACSIQVASIHKEFLTDVQFLLQTLGVHTMLSLMRKKQKKEMPGGDYECKDLYRLMIHSNGVYHLKTIGFAPKRLKIDYDKPQRSAIHFNRIVSVDDFEEYDDTYCFNEPLKHKGIFNGILTGNCTEIMEYTAPDEIAVCNLASICLPSYLKTNDKNEQYIDYNLMKEKVKVVTRNLNKIIDRNFYPNEKAKKSNFRHRPIGIGVQGLADLYIQLGHAFESPEAADINKKVFATIYYGALEASMELAKERAGSENVNDLMNEYEKSTLKTFLGAYATYEGSPISEGKLQYDLWNVSPEDIHDWDYLKGEISKYGVRNSLLLAPMPTASTAQIMGFTEAFEPITANIYKRRTLAGEFIVVNKNLVKDLKDHNLWDKNMKEKLIVNNGSVQSIEKIPDDIKLKYKTVWEISQKHIINQAADRGAYIDQSQSMNLFMEDATYKKLTNMHFYAWKKGLKTGMYYLRTKAKAKIQQFSIDANKTKSNFQDGNEECVMCSA